MKYEPRRLNQRTMGTAGRCAATPKAAYRPTSNRSPAGDEWHTVGIEDWCAVARSARKVWQVDHHIQPLSTLAQTRRLGSDLGRIADDQKSRKADRLGNPLCGCIRGAGAPTCRRGKKSSPEREALGRSRGGLSTKIHLRVDRYGQIITFLLTPGQQHEISVSENLMEQGWIKQANGRNRLRPKRVVGDKGYTSKDFRNYLRQRGVCYTIPRRSNEKRKGKFDKEVYRERNKVERLFSRLKEFRRIATRYEKRAANYAAMLTIAAIFLWSQGFAYTP